MVYGRAGDEILYFRKHGFESIVIPGVSSAIAGPTFAGIPVTQRGVAESMILCTGVGRQGKPSRLPGYIRSRTLVLLMGVARLDSLLKTLLDEDVDPKLREGERYPSNLPIAIIERASMPDQRVVSATLGTISAAMTKIGEQRPPGMIVVGWSVLALHGDGDVEVLDDAKAPTDDAKLDIDVQAKDKARVERWLAGESWRVSEGSNKWI
jgi:uroporphyrin-III C-methyltransferase